MADQTFVSKQLSTARSAHVVGVLSDGDFYPARGRYEVARGRIGCTRDDADGTLLITNTLGAQVGFVDRDGTIRRGLRYSGVLVGTVAEGGMTANLVDGSNLVAEGARGISAVAAAAILLPSDTQTTNLKSSIGEALVALMATDQDAERPALVSDQERLVDIDHAANRRRKAEPTGDVLRSPSLRRRIWGIPWKAGQYVHVRTPTSDHGPGVVRGLSTDFDLGFGTKVYPAVIVELLDNRYGWFFGADLSRLSPTEYQTEVERHRAQ